jgi:hypothetical protein
LGCGALKVGAFGGGAASCFVVKTNTKFEEGLMVGKSIRFIGASVLVSSMVLLLSTYSVHASEGGGSMYAGGNEDFMAGALPPPGFHFINYFLWYHADEYKDLRIGGVKARDLFGEAPEFDLDVVCNAFRFLYVSNIKVLDADLAFHLILPILYMNADISLPVAHLSDSSTGFGDTTFGPALGWHSKNWHLIAALDVNAPTGDHDLEEVALLGRNYWDVEPVLAVTYLSDCGFEISAKFMYDFNLENPDTDYTSGQEFHFDYLIGQHIGDWNVGINGAFYVQTTDDDFSNEPEGFDGNKGRSFSIGPVIQYNYKNMFFNLKYQWDTAVENRPQGEKLWFKFFYAF